ncbi:hypothetical protein GCM10020358_17290 [Amorphoplanes nipponensis]|uniref:Uncharacterized protein n=1 Tax=Actinoplanes nipponensis TaxID=135950 RepID=A0A919JH22_9ACTN|nr:hypothetical protein Ani05nite_41720 [Actinoplanes nipponensis]
MRTFAVAVMVIVTGAGPQSKVMTPPAATAATTAADVQLPGVPRPTTRSGRRVSSARASAGTGASPSGLPGLGSAARAGLGDVVGRRDAVGPGCALTLADARGGGGAGEGATEVGAAVLQPESASRRTRG